MLAARARTAVCALMLAGCTPTQSHLEPYRDDPIASAALEARAIAICREQHPQLPLPPHPFTTDGCTAWIDDGWVYCCVVHDIDYWCGDGSDDARRIADEALRQCVAAAGNPNWGALMYLGTRLGGAEWMPVPWRWGYGWDWLEAP